MVVGGGAPAFAVLQVFGILAYDDDDDDDAIISFSFLYEQVVRLI